MLIADGSGAALHESEATRNAGMKKQLNSSWLAEVFIFMVLPHSISSKKVNDVLSNGESFFNVMLILAQLIRFLYPYR